MIHVIADAFFTTGCLDELQSEREESLWFQILFQTHRILLLFERFEPAHKELRSSALFTQQAFWSEVETNSTTQFEKHEPPGPQLVVPSSFVTSRVNFCLLLS
jgi:hypothetical protein